MSNTEIIGYIASGLIALAMTQSAVLRLRIIGLIGSLTMGVYGAMLGAIPIILVNLLIGAVHLYHLFRLTQGAVRFDLTPIPPGRSGYLDTFLEHYGGDIRRYFPSFDIAAMRAREGFFVLRDLVPVGLVLFEREPKQLRVHVDYVTPNYRDLKSARFAYRELAQSIDCEGIERFVIDAPGRETLPYFKRIGFSRDPQGQLVRALR